MPADGMDKPLAGIFRYISVSKNIGMDFPILLK